MKNIYINKPSDELSKNYSTPTHSKQSKKLPQTKIKGSISYDLHGISNKKYSPSSRVLLGVSSLGKTLVTLGIGPIISKSLREDWKTFWKGKRIVAVYKVSPNVSITIPAVPSEAKSQNQVSVEVPKKIEESKTDESSNLAVPSETKSQSQVSDESPKMVERSLSDEAPPISVVQRDTTSQVSDEMVERSQSDDVTIKKDEPLKEPRHLLRNSLFIKAVPYIDEKKFFNLPRATSGRTRVFFPDDLPIVLKQSGSPANQKRLDQMGQARDICDASNYSHVVIPNARIHGNFIIESRLPIRKNHDTKEEIGFYLENREELTSAIEQFTGFICQSELDDITGKTNDKYSTLSKVPIGRYDNVVMYVEEGVGKIGLIDLEGFKPGAQDAKNVRYACLEAVRLFPHHLETIILAAKEFSPEIENFRKTLEYERTYTLEYFEKAYQKHLNFIQQKNIDFTNPIALDEISHSLKEKMQSVIESEMRKEHEEPYFKGCLGENPNEALRLFNEVAFPQILEDISTFMTELLKGKLEYIGGKDVITSYSELTSLRTLEFNYHTDTYRDLKRLIASKLDMLIFDSKHMAEGFVEETVIIPVLKELEKSGEIAYYNPSFGIGGYAVHCIFC